NPDCHVLHEEKAHYLQAFNNALLDEEHFLKQKAKVEWLQEGDSKSTYFHKVVKSKCHRSRIEIITDSNGVSFEGNDVLGIFVSHFETFLGVEGNTIHLDTQGITKPRVRTDSLLHFFKKSWDVVGSDICLAVQDFFSNGKLLKELNHIILALIPTVSTSAKVTDYRPISYYNVLYECISKIIINRIKEGLGDVVDMNQYTFVPRRRISDNILLTQELMRNYHRPSGPPRCAFKIDIVDWYFLEGILSGFSFHPKMISWIMACVTSPSYSICMNGNLFGMFKGKRGLRKGDLMSLYLFTLVMEVLTLLLQRKALDGFQYHRRCDKQKKSLSISSGLVPSIPKSKAYFCNVPNAIKQEILMTMPFEEGTLHVRYLGVPFISLRLLYRDCKVLTERLQSCVVDWRNKSLSLTRRLQLIMFVLSSMHIYLASIFILPAHIILDLEQSIRPLIWHKISNGGVDMVVRLVLKYPSLTQVTVPALNSDVPDRVLWRDSNGILNQFSVSSAWQCIWISENDVPWFNVAWFHQCIPRHAFHICMVQMLSGLGFVPPRFEDVVEFLISSSKGRSTRSIISRIVLAATCYFIWQERKARLFKKSKSHILIYEAIVAIVRLKLISFRFKKTNTHVRDMLATWKLPSSFMVYDNNAYGLHSD
ncbi:protein LAZ1, partial [Tanacetum coccineum]